MQEITKLLQVELSSLKERIAQNIVSSGSNASGDTIRSLFVQITGEGSVVRGVLYGRPFFGALETGTKPWRNQYVHPPAFFVDIIQGWIDAKGLDLNAYLVARKIMRQGSALYREGGRTDIYSNEIPLTLDKIQKKAADILAHSSLKNITLQ